MRPGGTERDPHRVDERLQLCASLYQSGRNLGKTLATPRSDLDLGGNQLPDEVRLERGAPRRGLYLFEPVDEAERRRVEQRELLLDGDREVGADLEALARRGEQLLITDPLLVTHALNS